MTSPPVFSEARNKRQKVRSAGLDPDYWYAVEYSSAVRAGRVTEVVFWGEAIAVFRGADGKLRALANRCAHRQLKLSLGEVNGCRLTCTYHGWTYDGDGKVVHYAHDLFGRAQPEVKVRSYPVTERYGLVWVFPGDPALATERRLPEIPELEGPHAWSRVDVSGSWQAHHSMIIDNVSDFSHAYLHRKYQPFWDAILTSHRRDGDRVFLSYRTRIGGGRVSQLFVDRSRFDTTTIDLCFEYPYQWSNTGGGIKHWCFVLPTGPGATKVFFIFYFDQMKVPFLPVRLPRRAMDLLMRLGRRLSIVPLLEQDRVAVEAEHAGYLANFAAPIVELNPAVHLFQDLTIEKWEQHLARQDSAKRPRRGTVASH